MGSWTDIYIADSRKLLETGDESIGLVVTSPPYWQLKDYGKKGQIGHGQTLHEYLGDLYSVWKDAYRVLMPGRRLVINIGNQFARSVVYGRYKIIPLHAEIIGQCETIGFDYMGSIVWQKKTTMNTTGGANIMGSYPFPTNGMVEFDYEYIAIFKKPGKTVKIPVEIKEKSQLTKEEWKKYFQGHWQFGGVRQEGHEAMFPDELPVRVIKMFSFWGETVLDPFLGSGTTAKAASRLGRNCIGYELNEDFIPIMQKKLMQGDLLNGSDREIRFYTRKAPLILENNNYKPRITDAKPVSGREDADFTQDLHRVIRVINEKTVQLKNGMNVSLLGIRITNKLGAMDYLTSRILKKQVFLRLDPAFPVKDNRVAAYVYMKNKIFVNAYMIKSGFATVDRHTDFKFKDRFLRITPKPDTNKPHTDTGDLYGIKAQ